MSAEVQAQTVPPLPPKGQMLSADQLYMTQISLYRNALAFGGTKSPSSIWSAMTLNQPETMAYYRELEDKDEDVSNCLDTLKLSVLKRDRSVQAYDDSGPALEVKEFIEQQLANLDFHTVLDCILDAPGYGFSVQEMMFDTSMGQASLIGIDDCPQELFLFGNRYQPQIGPLQLLPQPWASDGQVVPEDKFVVFTYRKRSRIRSGRPLLKAVFWPSWFKRNVQRLWLQYAEKGPGTAVVSYNDAGNAAQAQQAVEIAQAIVERTAIAIPNGFTYDVELLKVARAQDPSVYMKFFQTMQYSVARRILGETLTSFGNEGGGGSKAQGDTHADTLDDRSIELCLQTESIINRQIIRPLVLWNFGPKAPMPKWVFDTEEAEDLGLRLTIDSGLQRMGKQMSVGYVVDRYEVPLAEGEKPDAILVPNVNAPQVAIQDRAVANFSEAEKQAQLELTEFDKIFTALKIDAAKIYRERAEEIAGSVVPAAGE